MSVTGIPEKVKIRLWGVAAGRCEYAGCNKPLWHDSLTKAQFNLSYIGHIVADKPGGPRGDKKLSPLLKSKISNLMLLCDEHHRLIDTEDVDSHPVKRLTDMKRAHEERIQLATSTGPDMKSHVLLYGANIGEHTSPVSFTKAFAAMTPHRYPASMTPFELQIKNIPHRDSEPEYWPVEIRNLRRQFDVMVKPRIVDGTIEHLSVFAIAPQPLLVELGRLLCDINASDVYQLHREPPDWRWQQNPKAFSYQIKRSRTRTKVVAVNLSLSATITNDRITACFSEPPAIWTITIAAPNNDFLKSAQQLSLFRQRFRRLLNDIKASHGGDAEIHVFSAVPVAVAVEIGRVWMPKADLPLVLYENLRDGFRQVMRIPDISTADLGVSGK